MLLVAAAAAASGAAVCGAAPSGLPGPKGNQETFLWLAEAGRPGAWADVPAELMKVEGI